MIKWFFPVLKPAGLPFGMEVMKFWGSGGDDKKKVEVQCDECGRWVEKSDAYFWDGEYYCSNSCKGKAMKRELDGKDNYLW